jgi:hypothetical protein
METHTDPVPIRTDMIRTPVTGPKPANTLVFLQCRASGADMGMRSFDLIRYRVRFKSQFQIDGYAQARNDWYQANTLISATGMLRVASTTTDFEFLMALDSVEPFLDLDGGIGFEIQVGFQIDGVGLLDKDVEMDVTFNVCAYALVYEPRAELPPSGQQRQRWRRHPDEIELAGGAARRASGSVAPFSRLTLKAVGSKQAARRPPD